MAATVERESRIQLTGRLPPKVVPQLANMGEDEGESFLLRDPDRRSVVRQSLGPSGQCGRAGMRVAPG